MLGARRFVWQTKNIFLNAIADANGKKVARLRAGEGIELGEYADRVVSITGALHQVSDGEQPKRLLNIEKITELFDVKLIGQSQAGEPVEENYPGVTIGHGIEARDSLEWQINFGPSPSQFVRAVETVRSRAFSLPQGQSRWSYLDCGGARFDHARFTPTSSAWHARFAGGICEQRGVFDLSRFSEAAPKEVRVVFSPDSLLPDSPLPDSPLPDSPLHDPLVELGLQWVRYQPGAFAINLPADLPEQFGGRFDQARFASATGSVETYTGVVTEPADDGDYIIKRLAGSQLVKAEIVPRVEIGFTAVPLPIGQPRLRNIGFYTTFLRSGGAQCL